MLNSVISSILRGYLVMAYISGEDRFQLLLLPGAVDSYVRSDNPVRFIDAFVDSLDLEAAGGGDTSQSGGSLAVASTAAGLQDGRGLSPRQSSCFPGGVSGVRTDVPRTGPVRMLMPVPRAHVWFRYGAPASAKHGAKRT